MTLYLAYSFDTTKHARSHLADFWSWMADRNRWFYSGLDMVLATNWRIETQPGSLLIHHEVAFADERGLAAYRAALEAKGRDQAWEQRRREQDLWYSIVARSVQTSPPATMTLSRCSGMAAVEPDGPPETRALLPHPHPQVPAGVPHAPISGSTRALADDGSG
ncbi:hypothetical protein AB0G86_06550 [Streptomyces scabiei]|uniref:hypothetical protein n=1 Tax=Streptomyces scabiei TaxID=1930 RepID=UPI0033C956E7